MKPVHYVMWQIGPGGLELVVKQYSEYFYQHRKLYAYGLRPNWYQIYDESKVEVAAGNSGKLRPYWQYYRYCRKYRDDIFHLQSVGPLILLLHLLAGGKNVIYHIHGTIYWKSALQKIYLGAGWRWVKRLLPKVKATFVANSKYSASIFREKVLPVPTEVIYNGFDVQKFAAKKHLRTSVKRIGYAGRLWEGKNTELLIRLFEEVADQHPELELHFAGEGPLKEALEQQAQATRFADRIFFHGYLKDIPSFYASLDIFLFLSAHESFGNVIAEALLTGLPTLTSDVPVFEEIFGQGNGFVLGSPQQYDLIKKNFLKAIDNFPHLAQAALEISDSIEAQCSIENHLKQIEKVYEKH
ncbi:MAG: glycosyltransferase family 4 protein [Saprospiraceae bacterium]|nr:glycosyltransferase family 4 protein [Saprospiraceae bacterium]